MANENINNSYFDGHYKDIWRSVIPTGLTEKETEFMVQYFQLKPNNRVLDLMCGYGRHALALARQGIEVTAIDNLEDYINEISSVVKEQGLPVKAIRADIINYRLEESFDLAICMGNSLNFFKESEILTLLSSVCSRLNEGGQLLINTWSLAEIAIKQFVEKSWSTINELKYLSDSRYLFHPTRIETETTIISPEGDTEIKQAIDYIFSVAEMEKLLTASGFILKEIYSIPGRKKFQVGEPRAYIVAVKKQIQ